MIGVIDYGRGNLFSLGNALRHLDVDYQITDDPDVLNNADKLILPGVGAFGDAMKQLHERKLVGPIREMVSQGKPIAGICVGVQLLMQRSEEFGSHEGLGLLEGDVRTLPVDDGTQESTRIPNVGWRTLNPNRENRFLADLEPETMVYFVHSYAPFVENPEDIAATMKLNGQEVCATVCRENIVGYQFHPEKSGPAGLALLRRYLEM